MRTTEASIRKNIESYVPRDAREEKDKQQILRFIDSFDDVLTRDNTLGHFTASSFIVNKDRTKMLAVYHTIGDGWAHPGGHAVGEKDLLSVVMREAKEETIRPPLAFRKDESKGVKWIPFDEIDNGSIATSMRLVIDKLIDSLRVVK